MRDDEEKENERDNNRLLRDNFSKTLDLIEALRAASAAGAACRELSLAITRLEEAKHWLAEVT